MKSVALNALPRSETRRAAAKKLRSSGRIPAVIYGRQTKPQPLEINAREMSDLIHHSHSENILIDLSVKDDAQPKRLALVQEVQHHPLSGKVLHVDFHEVSENEVVTISVPVETSGEAVGVKTGGGVIEHVLFKLKVCGLPKNLPEQIVIDITSLELGKVIHIGDIKAPEGVEILGRKNAPVVSCALPRTEAEVAADTETATTAAGEVEMIKEKKEDGTEGAAPAKAGDKGAAPKAAAAGKGDAKAAPAGDKKAAAPAEKKK